MVKDVDGKEIVVGARVARPVPLNQHGSCKLEIRVVAKIKDGKIYLDGSNTPIKHPEFLAVLA